MSFLQSILRKCCLVTSSDSAWLNAVCELISCAVSYVQSQTAHFSPNHLIAGYLVNIFESRRIAIIFNRLHKYWQLKKSWPTFSSLIRMTFPGKFDMIFSFWLIRTVFAFESSSKFRCSTRFDLKTT